MKISSVENRLPSGCSSIGCDTQGCMMSGLKYCSRNGPESRGLILAQYGTNVMVVVVLTLARWCRRQRRASGSRPLCLATTDWRPSTTARRLHQTHTRPNRSQPDRSLQMETVRSCTFASLQYIHHDSQRWACSYHRSGPGEFASAAPRACAGGL